MLAASYEVLAELLEEDDLELDSFTAAELALAVRPEVPQLVPLEPPTDVEAAKAALAERAAWDPDTDEPAGDLAAIASLRSAPSLLVIADALSRGETASTYFYGIAEAGFLEERPSGDRHTFTVRSRASAARRLAELADPDGRAREDGEPIERRGEERPREWVKLERELERADHVLHVLAIVRSGEGTGEDVMASIASTPSGVWIVSGYEGEDAGHVRAQRCSRASLERSFAALLGGETR